ncbi:MAG: hypothetical protein LQ348_007723 [Seirophora lacunosa]|nr:MAG: hypothetical protein LQ348_007723 [Seirophora lacunosa]
MHLSTLLIPLSALFPLILALPNPAYPLYPRQNATAGETPVQRAGLVLNPEAAEEANPRDETATRAFAATTVKTSDGRCLTIDPFAGDFRQNLIPVQLQACAGGAEGQQWDVITKGQHVAQEGAMLLVSALTQGCLNFDPRRPAGDQVILFSCGGRADGGGLVADSQEFAFEQGEASQQLSPLTQDAGVCLVADGAKLASAACDSGDERQFFSLG